MEYLFSQQQLVFILDYILFIHTPPEILLKKATMIVLSRLKSTVARQVETKHPDISKDQKIKLTNTLFNELLKKESENVKKSIKLLSKKSDKFRKIEKPPYLLASDSFYYFDLTKNIIKNGNISDTFKGSKYLNKKMLAPTGHWEPINLHAYVGNFIYEFIKIFNSEVDLMFAVSFTPLIISILSLIAFLFACHFIECTPIATLTSSIFFTLTPIFIKRSVFGWYDNDPYNVLFPLLIISALFFGLKNTNKNKTSIITSIFISLLFMFYAFFWQGWVLLFAVLAASGFSILLFNHFIQKEKTTTTKLILFFSLTIACTFTAICISFGSTEFFILFQEGWTALKNFLTPQLSAWPDLYISVGELKNASLNDIIDNSGGYVVYIIAIIGLISSFITFTSKKDSIKIHQLIILFIFLIAALIIASGAQRFAILCMTPISILFTVGLTQTFKFISKFLNNSFKFNKTITTITLICIAASLITYQIIITSNSIKTFLTPIYNETWEQSLIKIKEETPTNSIINTWWTPGHFIKAIAERNVTFDGASINYPQAYWLANFFLSRNEIEALGMLRMLNNSGNNATDYLQEKGLPLSNSISLIKNITKISPTKSEAILNTILKDQYDVKKILDMTHKKPAPSYILLFNEFVENNLQLPFIGNWNFKAIEKINADPKLMKLVPNRKSREYIDFLWKLSGGPLKYEPPIPQISRNEKFVTFNHNILINLENMHCNINSNKFGKGTPLSVFYIKDNEIIEKKFSNANLPYSVILLTDSPTYKCILLDRILAQSILIRLYFFKGKGMKYFKPFSDISDLTNRTHITVFEIDWDKFDRDLKLWH